MPDPLSMDRPHKKTALKRMLWMAVGGLAALATAWLQAYAWWRDPPSAAFVWVFSAVFFAAPCAVAGFLVWLGNRLRRGGRRWGLALVIPGMAVFLAALGLLALFGWNAGPWHEKIFARGTALDGREWLLSQAWVDWFDGYDIRIFFREADGEWHSLCGGWQWSPGERVAEVRLDGPEEGAAVRTTRNGEWLLQGHPTVHPAETTPEELHAFHRAEMANLRAGKTRTGEAPQGNAP